MKIVITGGAGFVGANLAKLFKQEGAVVTAFDNLKRRGSELNLAEFKRLGIDFVHGDVRSPSDLASIGTGFDLIIEASAEPSVLAGLDGSPDYLLQTNLVGTLNCLEFARRHAGGFILLSTSRVYSIESLLNIPLRETETRFEIGSPNQPGLTDQGVTEGFCTSKARSLYGATKLASELIVQEYQAAYKLPCLINRCGVIAGPGQFGKVDQGVFTLWVANHFFGKPLRYTGFGGTGKQVRDLLHPRDLFSLLQKQIESRVSWNAEVFNVGGGRASSVSMRELTAICERITGKGVPMSSSPGTNPVDIPLYLTDNTKVSRSLGWKPKIVAEEIVLEIHSWLMANEAGLRPIFA